MNNFRNPYVDPYSFQGKVYDYYKNPTNPIHFSVDNQGGFEQKENQQNRKKNEYDKTKKHSLYINGQLEKVNDSKPVMFSPPKVDSIEKSLKEGTSDELSFNIAPGENSHIEKKDRKEVVSNLIKEFSLMLGDTSSINEEFTTLPESEFDNDSLLNSSESTSTAENNLGDEYTNDQDYKNITGNHGTTEDKFFNMFSESDELQEEMQNSNTNEADIDALNEYTDTLDGKFITMFLESNELQQEEQESNTNEANTNAMDESTSTMEDKFFTMLSENDELEEEESDGNRKPRDDDAMDESTDTMVDKFFTILSESDELEEEKQDGNRKPKDDDAMDESTDTRVDKFYTMLSESDELEEESDGNRKPKDDDAMDESTDTTVDKFYTMLSENDELEEEKRDSNKTEIDSNTMNENTDTLEDKFFKMLSESDKLQEEKPDSSFTNLKDIKSDEIVDLTNDDLYLCHRKPSFEKKRKYCINKNNGYKISCFKEIDDERFFKKKNHFTHLIEKKKTITVKMPVLLTELETDVDIVESTDLLMPLDNILKVEWSVQSLECKVVLPSKTVFLKGELTAEIEFKNKELENEIQSLKINIPWKKTENIHWLSVPDIPYSNQKEFMFQSQQEHNSDYHYEAYQKFAEPIQSQLKQVYFVWHQELNSTEKQLQVNGVAQLSIHIMQDQFIELDCYS